MLPQNMGNLGKLSQNQLNQGNQIDINVGQVNRQVLKSDIADCSGPVYSTIVLTQRLLTPYSLTIPVAENVPELVAEIQFGSGAFSHSVFVDWSEGSLISLPGTCINVRARWTLPVPVGTPFPTLVTEAQSRIGAMVAYSGVKASYAPATRTLRLFESSDLAAADPVIPAAGTGVLGPAASVAGAPPNQIPPYAKWFRLMLQEAGGGSGGFNEYPQCVVTQLDQASNPLVKSVGSLDALPLHPQASRMSVENLSAIDLNMNLQFDLVV